MTAKKKVCPLPISVTTTITSQHVGCITPQILRDQLGLPDNAKLTIDIPSGGDWSGETVELGTDIAFIRVTWETKE